MDGATTAANVAMMAMTTSSSMSVKPCETFRRTRCSKWRQAPGRRSFLDDTQHLLDRGEARLDLEPPVITKWNHAGCDSVGAEVGSRSAVRDGVADRIGH